MADHGTEGHGVTPQPVQGFEEAPFGRSPGSEPRRRNRRKAILLALLLLLLLAALYGTWYFLNYNRLPIPRLGGAEEEIVPPEYVFSIAGPQGADALTRPVGVAVSQNDDVFATDTKSGVIRVFDTEGRYQRSFSAIQDAESPTLLRPAHIAINQANELFVSDRRLRAIFVFDLAGNYLRKITLAGEESKTWSPLGMGFDGDGNLYVTDVGDTENHRIIVFSPDGKEIRRFGETGQAEQMSQFPGQFYFPNGVVMAEDGRLFVGDSDNRRVQVFDSNGEFSYFIRTAGIPRGLVIDDQQRLYVVDALGHMIDIYTLDGGKITSFGGPGSGPGQFRYANDVALDRNMRIYVTDRDNHQVQVWQWPAPVIVIPQPPDTLNEWLLCLSPLLLIPPLLLLARRRVFAVTPDFVDELVALGKVPQMDRRRFKWVTPEHLWPKFDGRVEEGIDLGKLVREQAHSESDARDMMNRLEISHEDAVLLVVAKRARTLCTEDERIATLSYELGVEALDARHFIEQFEKKEREGKTPGPGE